MRVNTDNAMPEYTIKKVRFDQKEYPEILSELSDRPEVLFYRGDWSKDLFKKAVAVVGSRQVTRYGERVTQELVKSFVASGVTIISGFMYGVDAIAHETAVEEKGRTIAVMGSGISQIYPPEHASLYTSILENKGVVMSEFKPEQKPKPWMYAKRNRIVAALANMGIIVIEASVKSGTMITADYAIKLQRPLYAVPGNITSTVSEGTNLLIKTGKAKLISSADDVDGVKKLNKDKTNTSRLSPFENEIFNLLKIKATPLALDEIAILLQVESLVVATSITVMQLNGFIEEYAGKFTIKD